jgi:peptidoglycan hydrolase CwlO-like protein
VVLPTGDHDRIGCFTDQVKLTRALVRDLDEAVKEVKLLGENEEKSSQKIMELEALCKRLKEDAQKLKEEKATLEGMVESHDELIMEIAKETGLDRMEEDAEDEDEEDEDADDRGDAAAPPIPAPPTAAPEEVVKEEDAIEMVPEQEAPVVHKVTLADAEPEMRSPVSTTH